MFFRQHAEDVDKKRQAVASLYESHYERVVRYISARIGSMEDSQELASDVFVKALRSVESYKESGAPMEAWIFKIAHNLVVDHLRKRSRRPSQVPIEDAHFLVGRDEPDKEVERRQELSRLKNAMERLSESQRQILTLRLGAEMSSDQVAAVLGKKPGAVREMQSAAIKKLRQILVEMDSHRALE